MTHTAGPGPSAAFGWKGVYGLVVAGFLLVGLVEAWPFVDDVGPPGRPADDWELYKAYALSILEGGLSLPAIQGPYVRPAGFLYNYFLAGVFGLVGPNTSAVYVLQSTLLGGALVLLHAAVRAGLSGLERWAYLAALVLFAVVDVYRNYTFRLLSENLALPLLALGFCLFVRACERQSWRLIAASGLALGLAVLARPNLGLVPVGLAMVGALYGHRGGWRVLAPLALFLAVSGATLLALPLRNLAATGQPDVAAIAASRPADIALAAARPGDEEAAGSATVRRLVALRDLYVLRAQFVLGFTNVLQMQFQVRWHWLAMWAGVALAVLFALAGRRKLALWEALAVVVVVLYLGPLMVLGALSSYGFRSLVPMLPFTLLLSVRCLPTLVSVMRAVRSRLG